MTESKIQPACARCTVELRADGSCTYCDPRGEDDAGVEPMTEAELAEAIGKCLSPDTSDEGIDQVMGAAFGEGGPAGRFELRSFADAGLLTNDAGIVVRIGSAEFQITVVRSR